MSLTLLLPPRLEFGDDLFFLESALAELARDLGTQCSEQLMFEFNQKTCFGTWKKHARQPSSTSQEDRILGAQIARSVVLKLAYRVIFMWSSEWPLHYVPARRFESARQ